MQFLNPEVLHLDELDTNTLIVDVGTQGVTTFTEIRRSES